MCFCGEKPIDASFEVMENFWHFLHSFDGHNGRGQKRKDALLFRARLEKKPQKVFIMEMNLSFFTQKLCTYLLINDVGSDLHTYITKILFKNQLASRRRIERYNFWPRVSSPVLKVWKLLLFLLFFFLHLWFTSLFCHQVALISPCEFTHLC